MPDCAECGFTYDLTAAESAGAAIVAGTAEFAAALRAASEGVAVRPAPDTWSPLEYGCHLRDVLLTQRERVLLARRADVPSCTPMGRDERVEHDDYAGQQPDAVARQLEDAAGMFAHTLGRLDGADWERRLRYNYPEATERSLRWVAVHTLHEVRHHLRDIGVPPAPPRPAEPESYVELDRTPLTEAVTTLLADAGADPELAAGWARVAVGRDARGDHARGVRGLPERLRRLESGDLPGRLELVVEPNGPLAARVHGRVDGVAQLEGWQDQIAARAAREAADRAAVHGIGVAACPKPVVLGQALDPIINAGQVGAVLVQNRPLLRAAGDPTPNLVGNNPLAVGAPGEPPFRFDGSLSTYSLIGLLDDARAGQVPAGAMLDATGSPSTDPSLPGAVYDGERARGGMAPLGGTKGFGLAVALELIAGAVSGGFGGPPPGKRWGEGALILAFGPGLFGVEDLAERCRAYLAQFSDRPGSGRREGPDPGRVRLPAYVATELATLAGHHGVTFPTTR